MQFNEMCVNHCGVQIEHKSTERQVDIKIKKQEERWWDRLTLQVKKPLFLAPDFDRWLDESDAEMELQANVGTQNILINKCDIYKVLYILALFFGLL